MKLSILSNSLFLLGCVFLVSCGSSDSGSGSGGDEPSLTLNGMSPDAFYSQMEYKTDLNEKYFKWHFLSTLLANGDGVKIPANPKNTVLINLYLQPGHKFTMIYKEQIDDDRTKPEYERRIDGTWRTDKMEFVIDGIGRGKGFTLNNSPAMNFTLSSDIHAAGISGRNIVIQYVGMVYTDLN